MMHDAQHHAMPPEPAKSAASPRTEPCCVIRSLLRREFLISADWQEGLLDFARMARQALSARETLVALHNAGTGTWSAWTSGGRQIQDEAISLYGSQAILDEVRRLGQPILSTHEVPLLLSSDSLLEHDVQSVLAVPFFWWETREGQPERHFGGCLYAHRSALDPPFGAADVELVQDLTELAQRSLNLLRHLRHVERDLLASRSELEQLRQEAATKFSLGEYETREPWFAERVLRPLQRIAHARSVNLLLIGPTGAGKSHLARAFHYAGPRRERPFVTLDCAQVVSAETLGPELFGYAPASGFANAPPKGMAGKAELADGGSLFIDEIGSLPLPLQQKLLRLIQTGTFSRLGSSEESRADLQIIAASNEDLAGLVRQGAFREDLYHRLREVTLRLPSLDQRRADVPDLARRFLEEAKERFGRPELQGFTASALAALARHDWSAHGNIRGLQHAVSRNVLLAPDGIVLLDRGHLQPEDPFEPFDAPGSSPEPSAAQRPQSSGPPLREARRSVLERKIAEHAGNISALAADRDVCSAFGSPAGPMPPSTLRLWIRNLGLEPQLHAAREQQRESGPDLAAICAALRQHGSGSAAARAMKISRHALIWQLRKSGLTVRAVLGLAAT
jgi:DNA-binding NtrC family response regulator